MRNSIGAEVQSDSDIPRFAKALFGGFPLEGFIPDGFVLDLQGWGSNDRLFEEIILASRPKSILELGSWKGASAIHMADIVRSHGLASHILCVDTWLGSHHKLWLTEKTKEDLRLFHGFPQQSFQFAANVVITGHQSRILPLPMTVYAAFHLISGIGLNFDVIYHDAHHDESEVYRDISMYWELLTPGGYFFGDDYLPDKDGVIKAVSRFSETIGIRPEIVGSKWVFEKA